MITSSLILSTGQGQGDVWQGGSGSGCLMELRHSPTHRLVDLPYLNEIRQNTREKKKMLYTELV